MTYYSNSDIPERCTNVQTEHISSASHVQINITAKTRISRIDIITETSGVSTVVS